MTSAPNSLMGGEYGKVTTKPIDKSHRENQPEARKL